MTGGPRWSETETLTALWRAVRTAIADDDLRFLTAAAVVVLLTAKGY